MKPRIWIPCLAVVIAVGAAVLLTAPPSDAGEGGLSKKAKAHLKVVESDAALNLRLMALDALRKRTENGIDGELVKVAEGEDIAIALYATRALGKRKTAVTKKALKALLEDTKVDKKVRIGALSAIAYHWKDAGDLPYLKSKTKDDAALASQFSWLKKKVYGR